MKPPYFELSGFTLFFLFFLFASFFLFILFRLFYFLFFFCFFFTFQHEGILITATTQQTPAFQWTGKSRVCQFYSVSMSRPPPTIALSQLKRRSHSAHTPTPGVHWPNWRLPPADASVFSLTFRHSSCSPRAYPIEVGA